MKKAFQRELHGYVALHDPCSVDIRCLPCFVFFTQSTRPPAMSVLGLLSPAKHLKRNSGLVLFAIGSYSACSIVGDPTINCAPRRNAIRRPIASFSKADSASSATGKTSFSSTAI